MERPARKQNKCEMILFRCCGRSRQGFSWKAGSASIHQQNPVIWISSGCPGRVPAAASAGTAVLYEIQWGARGVLYGINFSETALV